MRAYTIIACGHLVLYLGTIIGDKILYISINNVTGFSWQRFFFENIQCLSNTSPNDCSFVKHLNYMHYNYISIPANAIFHNKIFQLQEWTNSILEFLRNFSQYHISIVILTFKQLKQHFYQCILNIYCTYFLRKNKKKIRKIQEFMLNNMYIILSNFLLNI